jgi:hypothetical protein
LNYTVENLCLEVVNLTIANHALNNAFICQSFHYENCFKKA